MKMKKLSSLAVALLLALTAFAAAEDNASVYVVHGIPGADIGTAPPLPVDISVNGACALTDFKFGDIAGPVSLPAGNATVRIYLANKGNPCSGAIAIGPASFTFEAGENATLIASLMADGKPTARKYRNDDSRTLGGRARITVHHTAAAPAVDVAIDPKTTVNQFKNGERFTIEAPETTAQVSISPAGSDAPAFGPISLDLSGNTRYLVYAVGSVANNTFTLLLKTY